MKAIIKIGEITDHSIILEDDHDMFLVETGLSKQQAEKLHTRIDDMIFRFREKIIDDIENIVISHYDPDDWDFREKLNQYREQK